MQYSGVQNPKTVSCVKIPYFLFVRLLHFPSTPQLFLLISEAVWTTLSTLIHILAAQKTYCNEKVNKNK